MLTLKAATFLSVPFAVATVGYKNFSHIFFTPISYRYCWEVVFPEEGGCDRKALMLACVVNKGVVNVLLKPGISSSIKLEHCNNQNGKK